LVDRKDICSIKTCPTYPQRSLSEQVEAEYRDCNQSANRLTQVYMDSGSETWPVRKENEVALQRALMRMVRWMCNVKVKDRVPSKELRERLGIDDIILILQQNRLRWYGHVLRKEDTDWVKKCMEYDVEGSSPRGRPKRTWREVLKKIAKHVI